MNTARKCNKVQYVCLIRRNSEVERFALEKLLSNPSSDSQVGLSPAPPFPSAGICGLPPSEARVQSPGIFIFPAEKEFIQVFTASGIEKSAARNP